MYEVGTRPILVITERAIVFLKIRLRYARSIIMYGLPSSKDTLTSYLANLLDSANWQPVLNMKINSIRMNKEMTDDEKRDNTREILREKHREKSLVGLFDNYDQLILERFVGTNIHKNILDN